MNSLLVFSVNLKHAGLLRLFQASFISRCVAFFVTSSDLDVLYESDLDDSSMSVIWTTSIMFLDNLTYGPQVSQKLQIKQ